MDQNQLEQNQILIPETLGAEDIVIQKDQEWVDYQVYFLTVTLNEQIRKVPPERQKLLLDLLRWMVNDQKRFMQLFFFYYTNKEYQGDLQGKRQLTWPTDFSKMKYLHIQPKIAIAPKTGYLHVHMKIRYAILPTYGISYGYNAKFMNEFLLRRLGHNAHVYYEYIKSAELAMSFYMENQ